MNPGNSTNLSAATSQRDDGFVYDLTFRMNDTTTTNGASESESYYYEYR